MAKAKSNMIANGFTLNNANVNQMQNKLSQQPDNSKQQKSKQPSQKLSEDNKQKSPPKSSVELSNLRLENKLQLGEIQLLKEKISKENHLFQNSKNALNNAVEKAKDLKQKDKKIAVRTLSNKNQTRNPEEYNFFNPSIFALESNAGYRNASPVKFTEVKNAAKLKLQRQQSAVKYTKRYINNFQGLNRPQYTKIDDLPRYETLFLSESKPTEFPSLEDFKSQDVSLIAKGLIILCGALYTMSFLKNFYTGDFSDVNVELPASIFTLLSLSYFALSYFKLEDFSEITARDISLIGRGFLALGSALISYSLYESRDHPQFNEQSKILLLNLLVFYLTVFVVFTAFDSFTSKDFKKSDLNFMSKITVIFAGSFYSLSCLKTYQLGNISAEEGKEIVSVISALALVYITLSYKSTFARFDFANSDFKLIFKAAIIGGACCYGLSFLGDFWNILLKV
ncbi:hypothetical protein HK099_004011 [Clydaea vesicula]|uniref:Uncharacterized protein n=1 Tax=Clydaea vesicula TaxID=447962 RepID=A0AAD5U2H1_9FUNG|nr:hypothetical protein HK099_004011 [Clydaea vesicula]KAJ3389443.1 hypothetical protein HDU92_001017 [Lobulomyces angularis]